MNYEKIMENIKVFNNQELTINLLQLAKKINLDINSVFLKEFCDKKIDANLRFQKVKSELTISLYQKLKEVTNFEDEIIEKMMKVIDNYNELIDILVVDGEVLIKERSVKNFDRSVKTNLVDSTSLMEIKNINFKNELLLGLFVSSINSSLAFLSNEEILLIDNNNAIVYNLPDLNIYVNKNINELDEDNMIRVLVKYQDNVYTYDMRLNGDYLILANNNFSVWKLSELNKKEKQYTK